MTTVAPRHILRLVEGKGEQLGLSVSGSYKGTKWTVVSKGGHIGGTLLSSAGLFYELLRLDPFHVPQHFVLTVITAFAAGSFMGAWASRGKVDAMNHHIDDLRREIDRMATARKSLEKSVLKNRETSEKHRR